MIDIWDYAKTLPKLVVETKEGEIFKGQVIGVFDAEEFEDEADSLSLELESGEIMSFYPSDICSAYEY